MGMILQKEWIENNRITRSVVILDYLTTVNYLYQRTKEQVCHKVEKKSIGGDIHTGMGVDVKHIINISADDAVRDVTVPVILILRITVDRVHRVNDEWIGNSLRYGDFSGRFFKPWRVVINVFNKNNDTCHWLQTVIVRRFHVKAVELRQLEIGCFTNLYDSSDSRDFEFVCDVIAWLDGVSDPSRSWKRMYSIERIFRRECVHNEIRNKMSF